MTEQQYNSLQVPISEVIEGDVHTADEIDRQQDVIEVNSDLISRLYGVMFLVNRTVSFQDFVGPEMVPVFRQLLTEAIDSMKPTFSQLEDFAFEVSLNEDTGNFIVSGTNNYSRTILGFIQMAVRAPVMERRAVSYESIGTEEVIGYQ